MTDGHYNSLYLGGVAQFNRGDYFESHEAWEELWMGEHGESRRFFQGLIQAAVALYHLENGNEIGSRKLVASSAAYLQTYRPRYLGLDVDRFLASVRRCFENNADRRRGHPGELADRPEIRLEPPPRP